jgi:hypothetical protein
MENIIKIGKPVKPIKNPTNTYKVVINFMQGDADGDSQEEVLIDKDDPYLDRFITFLKNCSKFYPSGKGGYADYSEVKDYWLFCGGDFDEDLTEEEIEFQEQELEKNVISFNWDRNLDMYGVASFESYVITYFNESGIEHKVTIQSK